MYFCIYLSVYYLLLGDCFFLLLLQLYRAVFCRFTSSLGLIKEFQIPEDALFRFLMCLSRKYRDVPFHCWYHAFNVTQTVCIPFYDSRRSFISIIYLLVIFSLLNFFFIFIFLFYFYFYYFFFNFFLSLC
jgi:hypothetical protein